MRKTGLHHLWNIESDKKSDKTTDDERGLWLEKMREKKRDRVGKKEGECKTLREKERETERMSK